MKLDLKRSHLVVIDFRKTVENMPETARNKHLYLWTIIEIKAKRYLKFEQNVKIIDE